MKSNYLSDRLVNLFVSKARVKVLAYIFLKPQEPFYLRKIARTTECNVNSIVRELKRLEKLGLLFSKATATKRLYYLNPDFPFLHEIRTIFHKELGLGGQLLSLKDHIGNIDLILLTKTFIEGKISSPQDIDLLVVGEPDIRMIEVCVQNAQEISEKEINYMILNQQDYQMRMRRRDQTILKAFSEGYIIIWQSQNIN
jgi:hypothetical protein